MFVTFVLLGLVTVSQARWVIQNAEGVDMLEVVTQANGYKLFDDSGTGGNKDLSVWEPADIPGYWRTGHCAVPDMYPPSMQCTMPMVKDISGLGPADINRPLATPSSVDPSHIYQDQGSGANYDFGFWRIVCPIGFVAMSDFGAEGYSVPSYLTTRVRCVNIQLVHQCSIGAKIWDDEKTGADMWGSVWRVVNGENSDRFDQHFRANGDGNSNGWNPPNVTPYCFKAIVEVPDDE